MSYAQVSQKEQTFLDLTSLTVEEFDQLVPAFEEAFEHRMTEWRLDGKKRCGRVYRTYANCPLPTPEDRLLFILVYVNLHDMSGTHWQDYACGTDATGPEAGAMSGYLKAQVPDPVGFADLRQAILADDYRGKRVRLSGDIKTAGVEQHAALYLRVVDPERTRTNAERQQVAFQGTQNWTRYETQIEVPTDSVFILFGISLTGKGQIWVTNVQLESVA